MDIELSPFTGLNYNIDFSFIAFNLLPNYYRHLTNYRICQTVANTNQLFHDNKFLTDRFLLSQKTYVTGQTIVLEAFLNELFDITLRRIEIINTQSLLNQVFLYNKGEAGNIGNMGTFLYNKDELSDSDVRNTYLYNKHEVILDVDFTINVPIDLINAGLDINNLKYVVDYYKTVGTIYSIVYI